MNQTNLRGLAVKVSFARHMHLGISLAVVLAMVCPAAEVESSASAPAQRPNILFVFCDDHAYQAISAYQSVSAYGLKLNETPNIDRLAQEGMRFDNCYVTNSICGPCRAVIQTGKYSHLNGFYCNGNRFDGDQQTFPKLLQKAGYQTAIIGKWHLASRPAGLRLLGSPHRPGAVLQSADDQKRPARHAHGLHDRHHHRPGPGLAEEPARSGQAVHADVPAQGAAPQLAAGAGVAEHVRRRDDPRTGHAVRRLRGPRHGGQNAGHVDRQDDERQRPEAHAAAKPDARAGGGLERGLRPEERGLSRRPTCRARTSCAGNTSAT